MWCRRKQELGARNVMTGTPSCKSPHPQKIEVIGFRIQIPAQRLRIVSQRSPKTTRSIASAPDCSPELNGKILLVKTALTLAPGHREIKLALSWQCCTCWLARPVPWTLLGRKVIGDLTQLRNSCSIIPTCQPRYAHRHNSDIIEPGQPTASWLELKSAPQEGTHAW